MKIEHIIWSRRRPTLKSGYDALAALHNEMIDAHAHDDTDPCPPLRLGPDDLNAGHHLLVWVVYRNGKLRGVAETENKLLDLVGEIAAFDGPRSYHSGRAPDNLIRDLRTRGYSDRVYSEDRGKVQWHTHIERKPLGVVLREWKDADPALDTRRKPPPMRI